MAQGVHRYGAIGMLGVTFVQEQLWAILATSDASLRVHEKYLVINDFIAQLGYELSEFKNFCDRHLEFLFRIFVGSIPNKIE